MLAVYEVTPSPVEDHHAGQGLEHTIYEKRLKELGFFSAWGREGSGETLLQPTATRRKGTREDRASLFQRVHSDTMKMNGYFCNMENSG